MKQFPRYKQVWAIRLFLAIVGMQIAANWSLAQQTIFDESVLRKWHEYEDFSRWIQARARRTISGLEPGKMESYPIIYKQNRQCVLCCTNLGWDEPAYEFCMIANPRYSAEIKRNVSDHSNTLLRDYKEDPNAILTYSTQPLFDMLFATVSPHFTYRNVRLSDLVSRHSFQVNAVAKEVLEGVELIRIDHSYVYDRPHPRVKRQYRIHGSIYFDPARFWCIRQIKETEEFIIDGSRDYKSEQDVRYEVTDHPSGFPLIKNKTLVRTGYSDSRQRKIGGTETIKYETEVNENVPNDEFTLSAFGLPEPAGMEPVKKPLPIYVWILSAAGICAVIALAFRYLARRRAGASTA